MKIQTKLSALLLTLPLCVMADTLTIQKGHTSGSVGSITHPQANSNGQNIDSGSFQINGADNRDTGWSVTAKSTNGGKLLTNQTISGVEKDGHNLEYTISCDDVAAAENNGLAMTGVDNLALAANTATTIMSSGYQPAVASDVSDLIACTIDFPASETMDELFTVNTGGAPTLFTDTLIITHGDAVSGDVADNDSV